VYHRHPVVAPGITGVRSDANGPGALAAIVLDLQPDLVVHTAGLTNVDECERQPETADRLNVGASEEIAAAATRVGARLVHISSDHLFSGTRASRGEEEAPSPVNVYGRTKVAAEAAVLAVAPSALIIRTNFYGWGTPVRRSFSDWILDRLRAGTRLRMFTDAVFTPILVNHLSEALFDLLSRGATGVFNVAGRERVSKYEFGCRLAERFGYDRGHIEPASLHEFPFAARRPPDLSLDVAKVERLLGAPMPDVAQGLDRLAALEQEGWPSALAAALPRPAGVE
jgi:dTDP-4-dehydrorhamnose reductase